MGLDMYLSSTKGTWDQERISKHGWERRQAYQTSPEAGEAFDEKQSIEETGLGYWRKHSDLHGYFQKLYYDLTPVEYQAESFNCEYLVLDREMIYDIIDKAKQQLAGQDAFEEARGFFWGESMPEDWEDTIDIFERVLNQVDFENETVLYSSWW